METRLSPLLLLVFGATLFLAGSGEKVTYGRIDDVIVLKPPTRPTSAFSRILWKHENNLALELENGVTEAFHVFKGRSSLNTSTGELTIKNLTKDLSGSYTVMIDGTILGSVNLKVISPVPKPNIIVVCNEENTRCTLTCEGNVSEMDPKPTYIWTFNSTEHPTADINLEITPESTADYFICELINPVSRDSSDHIDDPFKASHSGPKINTGIIVFVCLLFVVVGVVLVHRVKSGIWFYEKDSYPWEADFWNRTGTSASSEPQHENDDAADERNSMMENN